MKVIDNGDFNHLALAQRLREVREHLGISQVDVAATIGIARNAVSQIETGARRIDSLELRRMANLYACPVNYLLGMDSAPIGATSALTRVLNQLSVHDHERVLQFAQFLRHQHTRTPALRLVHQGES